MDVDIKIERLEQKIKKIKQMVIKLSRQNKCKHEWTMKSELGYANIRKCDLCDMEEVQYWRSNGGKWSEWYENS